MTDKNEPGEKTPSPRVAEPEDWMRAAALEIFHDFGIEPFDDVIQVISGTIAKHYRMKESEPERARDYMAKHRIWLAEQKAKSGAK